MPNLQRVKALLPNGEVRYIRVAASALKKGLVIKAPKRTWKKEAAKRPKPDYRREGCRMLKDGFAMNAFLRFFHFPLVNFIVARFSSRSDSRCLMSSRLSNSCLPLPTASATFTLPFFQ